MICKNCGSEIPENENFCPICGAKAEPVVACANSGADIPIPFGIALTATILSWVPVAGLILAIIAMVKMGRFTRAGGRVRGLAIAARILSIVSLVTAILCIFYWIYVIFFFIAALAWTDTYASALYSGLVV